MIPPTDRENEEGYGSDTAVPFPSYNDLLSRLDAPAGSSWGVFGEQSDLGTINFLTPTRVRNASRLVQRGVTYNLDVALNAFEVPTSHQRKPIEHFVISTGVCNRDDWVRLYLQTGTQIDSLGHMRHYEHGFYNGAGDESVNSGDRLGIDQWARSCIVGRAVLIDIPRYLSNAGLPDLDYRSNAPITVRLLDDALSAQKTARLPGDMVLIRTGWLNFYFSTMSPAERAEFPGAPRCPGLQQSHDTLAWLWNSQVSLLAADNIGVEAFPPLADSPLNLQAPIDSGVPSGAMHLTMIPLLGLVLGELWWLDDLASDCAEDEVYEMLLVAKPLNIVGGVGSPANVTAIK